MIIYIDRYLDLNISCYACVQNYMYMYKYIQLSIELHAYACACAYAYMYMYMHMYMAIYMHGNINGHIYWPCIYSAYAYILAIYICI